MHEANPASLERPGILGDLRRYGIRPTKEATVIGTTVAESLGQIM